MPAETQDDALQCAVCDYTPDRTGRSLAEKDLRDHIETHSLASLWAFVKEHSGCGGGR